MQIVELFTKGELLGILTNKNSFGEKQQFLYTPDPKKRLEEIVYCAEKYLNKKFDYLGIEVKYKYGHRYKRIELVAINRSNLYLFKISKMSTFDKEGLELDYLISDIKRKNITSKNIAGIVLIKNNFNYKTANDFAINLKNEVIFQSFRNCI